LSHLKRLIHEIHRKSIWQVVGIYLLGGWIALQVVETLVDSLGLPEWFPAFAVMLLIVGFPIVVATAFVQDRGASHPPAHGANSPAGASVSSAGTPGVGPGLASGTGSLDRPCTRPPKLYRMLTWRNAIGGGVVAFALWGIIAAGWMGMNAYVDRQLGDSGFAPTSGALSPEGSAALKSVAVLPFANLSTDQENAFFADGIHEDVLTQLSKVGDLMVISRTSVLAYRDTQRPLAEIGEELGVGAIVEGSVRRSGDNVRITAQLIDARTDRHLWADNFDRALTAANVFAIQTEIAQRIADALSATLSPDEASRLVRQPTENLNAYLASLRGREAYRMYTDAANDEAIRLFQLATEEDPGFAEPWAGLADAYGQRVLRYGYGSEWADSAETAALGALEADPELATAHKALGVAHAARGENRASLEANLKAIELDPNYADPLNNAGVAYQRLGRLAESHHMTMRSYRLQPNLAFARANAALSYAILGDYSEAHARLDDALRFDPGDLDTRAYKGFTYVLQGDADRGADVLDEVLAQDPDNVTLLSWAADANLFAGRFDAAEAVARHSLELSPDQDAIGWRLMGIVRGFALREMGESAEADRVLGDVLSRRLADWEAHQDNGLIAFEIAATNSAIGDVPTAVEWLVVAYDLGWRYASFLKHDPVFDTARDDAGFHAVLQRLLVDVERQRLEVASEEAGGVTP